MIKRIAYLSTFYPFRGGIAQFNASLFRAFDKQGYEAKAFTFTRQYPDLLFPGKSQYVTEEDDTSTAVEAEQVIDTINPLSYFTAAKKIAAFQPDLLVMKFWMPYFGPSLGTVAGRLKQKGTKVVSILDNAIPHETRPGDKFFTHYFLNRNSGFVVMSEAVKNDLMTIKPDARYLFNPHPVYDHFGDKLSQSEAQEKLGLDLNKKTLLFFGLIRDYKGLDVLIEAFKDLPSDYQLVVAGEVYGEEEPYRNLASEYGLEDRVQLNFRYIADQEVPLFFSAADVNILPYKSATQSGILSIALHFDMPVIVTDVGGLREIVERGQIGLIASQPSAEAIRDTVQQFFKEDQSRVLGQNIQEYKETYSWKNMANNIVEFAESLA